MMQQPPPTRRPQNHNASSVAAGGGLCALGRQIGGPILRAGTLETPCDAMGASSTSKALPEALPWVALAAVLCFPAVAFVAADGGAETLAAGAKEAYDATAAAVAGGDARLWLACAAGNASSVLYPLMWALPGKLTRMSRALAMRPVHLVEAVVVCCKAAHFCAYLWFFLVAGGDAMAWSLTLLRATFAIPLGIVGQVLNFSVYTTIGRSGVYYGVRLGEVIPWVSTFPFAGGYVPHPQYVGATLSGIGLAALLWTPGSGAAGLAVLPLANAVGYSWLAFVESTVPVLG